MARPEKSQHEPASEHLAYVSSASKIVGNLFFQNAARIDGVVEGDIVAADELVVGDTAEIAARIRAPSVIVSGTVKGEIKASKRIEIRAPAKVVGTLTSPILVVQPGAVVDGHCAMPPPEAASEEHTPEPRLIVLEELAEQGEEPAEQGEEEQQPSQQGISFFITKRQRADLLTRGYDDAAIDKMTPGDAHRILGLI
ncbi:MAG TPA: polymer-forming cytoskeletal protein [Candidatus Binataceae bacterium]|jgi:cytoskeletal protein CcmA (bactofilin family)|nr:polymer-forming cytoskeletal protein [Candidatus Binataceae bacterium]